LGRIKERAGNEIEDQNKIHFFTPNQMTEFLDSFTKNEEKEAKRIRGYRVRVNYRAVDPKESD